MSKENCKPPGKTLSGKWDPQIKAHLQAYLQLGLTPIPLRGKIPQIRWRHSWNPKSLQDLEPYKNFVNWGIKTGDTLGVIDFDTPEIFAKFVAENIERLPDGLPLVKTGHGYHLCFRPSEPLRDSHFGDIDIKADGGQAVVPPSIHARTNRPYRFLWQLGDSIPELDLNTLHFPVKKREISRSEAIENIKSGKRGISADNPKFDYELIKDGVDEGQRHTALVSYIGYLIWRGMSKEEIRILVADWNEKNRPHLLKAEVDNTVEYCYSRYAKEKAPDKNAVSIKTQATLQSVLVGTKSYTQIDHRHSLYPPESPNPTPAPDLANSWETEDDRKYTYQDCDKKRAIMRKGREYMSVSFFCGRWNCPMCGPYFRQRWIEHITAKTEGAELYVTEISEKDWAHVRRAINRLGADYMKINSGGVYKIITDKPLKGSTELKRYEVKGYLESSIPTTASKCPISTSRNWEHHKKEKISGDYEAVTVTWLPVKDHG